jgi:hypothetical protein
MNADLSLIRFLSPGLRMLRHLYQRSGESFLDGDFSLITADLRC